jgi:serine kinase of HPr protein (carbohydrate metabolism regulator)
MDSTPSLVHASCVALGEIGVLIRGPAGAGKSDLALRMIDGGAFLVADDYVRLWRDGERLRAAAAPRLAGLIEVRGIGPLRLEYLADITVGLVLDLVARAAVERLPESRDAVLFGVSVPRLALHAFDAAAPAKLRLVARLLADGALAPVTSLIGRSA